MARPLPSDQDILRWHRQGRGLKEVAKIRHVSFDRMKRRLAALKEANPSLGVVVETEIDHMDCDLRFKMAMIAAIRAGEETAIMGVIKGGRGAVPTRYSAGLIHSGVGSSGALCADWGDVEFEV